MITVYHYDMQGQLNVRSESGTEADFVRRLNEEAQECGCPSNLAPRYVASDEASDRLLFGWPDRHVRWYYDDDRRVFGVGQD